jgi:hypothetical protein
MERSLHPIRHKTKFLTFILSFQLLQRHHSATFLRYENACLTTSDYVTWVTTFVYA